jgi:hypothetical protein
MGLVPLKEILIGKFQDDADAININKLEDDKKTPVTAFKDNCPLWTYCLAETNHHTVIGHAGVKSKVLGPVGGRIVAETFAGLLLDDSQSFLGQDPRWKPTIGDGKPFGLKEFVNFALGR